MRFDVYEYTELGPREENQDSFGKKIISENIISICIADGVGGKNGGKMASEISVKEFLSKVVELNSLDNIVLNIHGKIKDQQKVQEEFNGMATTFTGCLINEYNLKGVQVGDSRLCVLRKNGLKQLTESHTEVYRLIKEKKLSPDDAKFYPRKNVIESALGIKGDVRIQTFNFNLQRHDRILLTTDGVHEIISKKEFRDLSVKFKDIQIFGQKLKELLNSKKLKDNATFLIVEVN